MPDSTYRRPCHRGRHVRSISSGGATLLFTAVLLIVTAAIATAAFHFLLSGRLIASLALDRELAFRAAEVALLDAETELLAASRGAGERLAARPAPGRCGTDAQRGLCTPALDGLPPWQDWLDPRKPADAIGVTLGTFTGVSAPVPQAGTAASARAPRYVVEWIDGARGAASNPSHADDVFARMRFRITALGVGRDPSVRAILQTVLQP
jgi:Tfp pilus assembly protein PilX